MTSVRKTCALVASVVGLSACAGGGSRLPAPGPQSFDRAEVVRGAELAKLGECRGCHTAEGGVAYAGGAAIQTPFGAIYSSNLTPDRATGLGRYSRQAFVRAMRQGVRADGAQLYPAFPYDHFAYAQDADLSALYAFLMTRRAVAATPPPNQLTPPLGFRPIVGAWKALFFHPKPGPQPAGRSAEWQRVAYLVQALGHCGACHTPHNRLGAEQTRQELDGGYQQGWYAPPLNELSPASAPWTVEGLERYLRSGIDLDHAAAAGPMGEVTRQFATAPQADLHAIAVYLADLMRPSPGGQGRVAIVDRAAEAARAHPEGATLYAGACASCHDAGAGMMLEGRPALARGTPLHEADPRDTIQIILQGLEPPAGPSGPYMPAFASSLTDAQIAEITAYLRARYTDKPAWADLTEAVAKARKEGAS